MEDPPPAIRLVAGLGNPGPRYSGTRHNAGRLAVELVARRLDAGRFASRYRGRLAELRGPHGPLALLLPETFMNESGESVGPAAGALRAAPSQVLVVHDEIDLPFGEVRGKPGGGHGGHNGLRSVSRGLGGGGYPRVRLGVGRPPDGYRGDEADWVLARFSEPAEAVDALVARGADMIEAVLADGIEAAMNRFHASPPGERARARAARREGDEDEAPASAEPAAEGPDGPERPA